MCNPLWAHTGSNCDEPSWTSWALVTVLGTVSVVSVVVLASAARRLSTTPSGYGSGVLQLAKMLYRRPEEQGGIKLFDMAEVPRGGLRRLFKLCT